MVSRRFASLVLALPLVFVGVSEVLGQQAQWTPALDPACAAVRTPPQIFSEEVAGPQTLDPFGNAPFGWNPLFGRLSRGGVHYVSADYVRVKLVTDRCSQIIGVRFGSRVLTTTNTDGFWYFVQFTDPAPGFPGQVEHNVMVHFPYGRDGSTETVTVTAGRLIRTSTNLDYRFPVVRVNSIEAQDVSAPIGFSQAEVSNMFGKALYEVFNREQNSAVITKDDGGTVRIYGYDPTMMHLSIDQQSVSFGFFFTIDKTCQPVAHVQGTFKLNADSAGISLAWVIPPYTNLQWPPWCLIAQQIPGLAELFSGADSQVSAGVKGRIETAVKAFLPTDPTLNLLLDGSSIRPGELLVNLRLYAPSVKIQVPYDAFDMVRSGTAFPAGETFTLVASGLGVHDAGWRGDYNWAVPADIWLGPNGVPRFGTVAWHNPLTLSRSGPLLVQEDVPVGRLMARRVTLQQTVTYQYAPGCSIEADSSLAAPVSIRFGVNDTASDAQRVRPNWGHGYWVRVFFFDSGNGRRCRASTVLPDSVVTPPFTP